MSILLVGCSQPTSRQIKQKHISRGEQPHVANASQFSGTAKFNLYGASSEGSEVVVELDDGSLKVLNIVSYGSMGISTITYNDRKNTIVSLTTFFSQTGNTPKEKVYYITANDKGLFTILGDNKVKAKFLECVVGKIMEHAEKYKTPYPRLHVMCH